MVSKLRSYFAGAALHNRVNAQRLVRDPHSTVYLRTYVRTATRTSPVWREEINELDVWILQVTIVDRQ